MSSSFSIYYDFYDLFLCCDAPFFPALRPLNQIIINNRNGVFMLYGLESLRLSTLSHKNDDEDDHDNSMVVSMRAFPYSEVVVTCSGRVQVIHYNTVIL